MYGMEEEHYVINPREESGIFFVRENEFQKFYQDLLATFDSGRSPRYVVFGFFGVGKTHFLRHLEHQIAERAHPLYVATPASHRRTSFVEFYASIISELGRSHVTELITEGVKKPAKLRELGLSEDLVYVIENAVKAKENFLLWKLLTGVRLKSSEADRLESVRNELSADDAAIMLNVISSLYEAKEGKPLLLLIDEFENTGHIGGDAKITFTEAVRSLVDEGSRVGVVFALTARALSEMPSPVAEEPVRRRIGLTNYLEFKSYNEAELRSFIMDVIRYRREPRFDVKKAIASIKSKENVTEDTYPFTFEAIQEIVNSVLLFAEQQKIEAVRPKEALDVMDKALRISIKANAPFISKDVITSVREDVVQALSL